MAELIVALDTPELARALDLYRRCRPATQWVKVGLELFTSEGPRAVAALAEAGARVFLDLKYHDIPNTVAGAVRAARGLGAAMLTVHAAGGAAMLAAAREEAREEVLVVAVTALTSLGPDDLAAVGVAEALPLYVARLWRLAWAAGLAGVVAAPWEAEQIRAAAGPTFRIVTPGVRPGGADLGDQRRVATPAAAVAAGSDFLVVGRPITQAPDPLGVALAIRQEMDAAGEGSA